MQALANVVALRDSVERFLEALSRAQADRKLQTIIKELEKAYRDAFREQGRLFVQGLDSVAHTYPKMEAKKRSRFAQWWWEYIMWWIYLERAMQDTLRAFVVPTDLAAVEAYYLAGFQQIADAGIGLSFNLANPRAVAYLRDYGAKMISKINPATRNYIHDILVEGMENGWGYDKVAKRITNRYEEFAIGKPQKHIRSRAHLVAVTEMGNAYEAGNFEAAMQLEEASIAMEKAWANVGDDRVSDGCRENTAAGWIPLTAEFPAEAVIETGKIHPLRFPGCRCHGRYRRMKVAA